MKTFSIRIHQLIRYSFSLAVCICLASCSDEKEYTQHLENYYQNIRSESVNDFREAMQRIERCPPDTGLIDLKNSLVKLNKYQELFSKKADSASDFDELQTLEKVLLDSLMQMRSYNKIILHNIKSHKLVEKPTHSVPDFILILKTNILILERKIRDEILGQWAIDC